MWENEEVPITKAQFVVQSICIEPTLVTPDVLPVCTYAFAPTVLPLLENISEALFFFFFLARLQNCENWLVALLCLFVFPHGTGRLPLDRFPLNLVFEYSSKVCLKNSSFTKIIQKYWLLYVKTYVHLWWYIAEFFLEWGVLWTRVGEKIKTHCVCSITSPPPPWKLCHLWDIVQK